MEPKSEKLKGLIEESKNLAHEAPPRFPKIHTLTLKEHGFAPGILQPGSALTPENHPGIQMEFRYNYIHVKMRNREVGIPLDNVKGWVFE